MTGMLPVCSLSAQKTAGSTNALRKSASATTSSPPLNALYIKDIEALLKFDPIDAAARPGNNPLAARNRRHPQSLRPGTACPSAGESPR
ncbi:MAG: hypothetical protein OQK79_09350 [Rhodanobacter sp.]|nr:hypothetical protein [Rhodanobacter sp.]